MTTVLCFLLFFVSIIDYVNGTTTIFQNNTTWKTANSMCIDKGGRLASIGDVNCTTLSGSSVWLGGYQKYIWVKPLGCYETKGANRTTAGSIADCLQHCNTQYIGFLVTYCYCFDILPVNQPTQYILCTSASQRDMNVAEVHVVMDSKEIIRDNGNCVRHECDNAYNTRLVQTVCSYQYHAFCDGLMPKEILQTHALIEATCKTCHSFIKSDVICTNESNSLNQDGVWTGIKRYVKSYSVQEAGVTLNTSKTDLLNCVYGTCLNNQHTMDTYTGSCDDFIDHYACVFSTSKTTKTTARLVDSDTSFTEVIRTISTDGTTDWSTEVRDEARKDDSKKDNYGLIAGVSVTLVCLFLFGIGVICFFRRRISATKDRKLSSKRSDRVFCTNEKNQQQYVPRFQSNDMNELSNQRDKCPKSENEKCKQDNDELCEQEYAVVAKTHKDNPFEEHESSDDGEYNRLDHFMKVKTETTSVNVYDTMMGERAEADPTYNTTMYENRTKECQYDTFNMESIECIPRKM